MRALADKLIDEAAFRGALAIEWFRITVLRERCAVCHDRATTLLYSDGPAKPVPICAPCFDFVTNVVKLPHH